jgi:hypothetical protein
MQVLEEGVKSASIQPIKFETPLGTRISEQLLFGLLFLIFAPIAGLGTFFAGFCLQYAGLPVAVGVIAGIFLSFGVIRSIFRLTMARLRFCVVILDGKIEIGRGWACHTSSFEDVELISVHNGDTASTTIQTINSTSRTFLTAEDAQSCADELRKRCLNAVYVDAAGTEFLPAESRRPLRNLILVERRCFKISIGLALLSIFSALIAGMAVMALVRPAPAGTGSPSNTIACLKYALIGATSPLVLWQAIQYFKKAIQARESRKLLSAQGVQDE